MAALVCLGAEFAQVGIGVHFRHCGAAVAVLVVERCLVDSDILGCERGIGLRAVFHGFYIPVAAAHLRRLFQVGGEAELRQNRAAAPGELVLVVNAFGQGVDAVADALVHEAPPEAHHVLGGRRQFPTRQTLADHQPHGHAERRFGFRGHRVERRLLAYRFQRGVQIAGHPFHPQRADGGDAGVLYPIEHLVRRAGLGRAAAMHRLVVVAQFQGELVADAAHGVQFLLGTADMRQRHMDAVAADACHALAVGDFDVFVFGNRA